jgi:DNA repair protein RecN (Recombination protein N)
MLRSLSIRDFVIVDRLELEFRPGFTVLTGETGAGKSILVDALDVVLGARADAGLVREGREKAEISAEFSGESLVSLAGYLEQNDLAGEPGECLIRRLIEASGRSRAYVNGRQATVQQLREIGEFLVDIHGQHENQSLMRAVTQRQLLDGFADAAELAATVARAWQEWQALRNQRIAAETNARALADEREQMQWQIGELDGLGYQAEEWDTLQAEHRRLAHAASLIEAVQFSMEALSEGENCALGAVGAVQSKLAGMTDYDPALNEILGVIEPARIQIQEAVYSLRHYQNRLDLDPQRFKEVENRLDAIHACARKFRLRPQEIPERLHALKSRLAELDAGLDAAGLKEKEEKLHASYLAKGGELSAKRKKAAAGLARSVTAGLQQLAMSGGVFEVSLAPLSEGNANGLEQVEFLVSGHAGATPRPLAKIASGGELSRISLAIQAVTSRIAAVPTLVFDEVDAGIGGGVAEIVGRMLRELGSKHQIMCVTHLPQVAAAADHQWQVSKIATGKSVTSSVAALDRDGRVEEIARMLGGVKITETTRKHAAELLKSVAGAR